MIGVMGVSSGMGVFSGMGVISWMGVTGVINISLLCLSYGNPYESVGRDS